MPKPSAPERAQPEQRSAQVPETAAGRRFDAVLAELFPEFSRSRLAEWIKSGDALLDGAQVRPREPVRGGEAVTLSVLLDTRTESEPQDIPRSEEHTSELQSLMRTSYAVFCLKNKKQTKTQNRIM